MYQDILHLSNQTGLFHSVIPQLLLLPSPIGSSDITEIQDESTAGDIDLGVFYTPLNRDQAHGLRIFAMKMESSSSLSISFKHIFSRAGRSERVSKAMWPSAKSRDVFQSHWMTRSDAGKYLMKLTGLYQSRCRGWETGVPVKSLCTCEPKWNWRVTVIHHQPVNVKVEKRSNISYFRPTVWDVLQSVFGTGQNSYNTVTII